MFIYNGREYDNVWFTSDEHYNSGRHLTLSCRLGFEEEEKEKRIREYEAALDKTNRSEYSKRAIINLMRYGVYGASVDLEGPVEKMTQYIIDKHNSRVGDNDIVFHIGDFGDYEYAKYLNGHHVLILGNYEARDMADNYNKSFTEFHDRIVENYNFIDVLSDYNFELDDNNKNNIKFSHILSNEVCEIFLTHTPSSCCYHIDEKNRRIPFIRNNKRIMNLFGHIHEKCKVKRFGLNVGVDAHHFYPVSKEEVDFYLYAIIHYYDNEVFM
jgi:calcineurin-like phosphoesterase family protein